MHAVSAGVHETDTDAFALFEKVHRGRPLDAAHAFYLGHELAKAVTVLYLGKEYRQDERLTGVS